MKRIALLLLLFPLVANAARMYTGFDSQAIPTSLSPGTVSFTDTGLAGQTPKAAICVMSAATTTGTQTATSRYDIAIAANNSGTTQASLAGYGTDGVAQNSKSYFAADRFLSVSATTNVDTIAESTVTSWDVNGITVTFTDIDLAFIADCWMFAGDISAKVINGTFPTGSPNDLTMAHGLGAAPDVGIFLSDITTNAANNKATPLVGFWERAGGTIVSTGVDWFDVGGTSDVRQVTETTSFRDAYSANFTTITVNSTDATNIVLRAAGSTENIKVAMLVMRATSGTLTSKAGFVTSPTSTSTTALVSGLAARTNAILTVGSIRTTNDSSVSDGSADAFSLGGAISTLSGIKQGGIAVTAKDGVNPIVGKSWTNAAEVLTVADADGNLDIEATAQQDAGGWSGIYSNVNGSAMYQMYLTFGIVDTDPGVFTFTDRTSQPIGGGLICTAAPITVGGAVTQPAVISVTGDPGASYKKNGGAATSSPGTVISGDTVDGCVNASGSGSTTTNATVTIDVRSDVFSVTTSAAVSTAELMAKDTFTDTTKSLPTHALDVDAAASGWTIVQVDSGFASGAAIVNGSNQALIDPQTGVVTDVGTPYMWPRASFILQSANNHGMLLFRFKDLNNYDDCVFNEVTQRVILHTRTAGVSTAIQSTAATLTDGQTYEMGAFAGGTTIGCTLGGVLYASGSSSANLNETKVGIGVGGASIAMKFDGFSVTRSHSPFADATGRIADDPLGLYYSEVVGAGSLFALDATVLNAHSTFTLRNGGSFKWVPTLGYVGADSAGLLAYNSTTAAINTATINVTTQDTTPTAPSWTNASESISTPIGVNFPHDLVPFMSVRGIPPGTCALQSGTLIAGTILDSVSCSISGSPNQGYTAVLDAVIRNSNATGNADLTLHQTVTGDSVPDFPSFTAVPNATPSAVTPCTNTVTLTGVNIPGVITVSGDTGAKYSLNGGAYTASAGMFVNNNTVAAEVTAGTAGQTKIATVTAGGVSQTCSVTATPPPSSTVNPFSFATALNVVKNSPQSACTLVDGNTALAAVSVSGGTCTINGGACPGNLPAGGGTVCALHNASATASTPTNTNITISGQVGTFTSITADDLPLCNDLPNQNYKVADHIHLDMSAYCSNVVVYSGDTSIANGDATRNGSIVDGTAASVGEWPANLQISNNSGSRQIGVVFHIQSVAASPCAANMDKVLSTLGISVSGAIGVAVRRALCAN